MAWMPFQKNLERIAACIDIGSSTDVYAACNQKFVGLLSIYKNYFLQLEQGQKVFFILISNQLKVYFLFFVGFLYI